MKYKIGDTVTYQKHSDIEPQQGVIIAIINGEYLITCVSSSETSSKISRKLENFNEIFSKPHLKELISRYPNHLSEWVVEMRISSLSLPKNGTYYTVLDDSIPGGKMIFRSNGFIESCGKREDNVSLLTNFNSPGENMKFLKSGELCFMDCEPRYFFPSPQEDIDLLNSYINKGTKSPEKEIVYSGMKKITNFGYSNQLSLEINENSLPFVNEYRARFNSVEYKHPLKIDAYYSHLIFQENMNATYNKGVIGRIISLGEFKELTGIEPNNGELTTVEPLYIEQKTENMVTITREQLKEIHDIACDTWKTKIEKIARNQPFGDIELSETKVQEMRDAATGAQKPTLEKIFGVAAQFKVNVWENKVTRSDGREISLFSESCFVGGVLSPSREFPGLILVDEDFDIKISNSNGNKYIEIIEKK